jgi:N6-L-threonylcarbamoyladenine synthase
MKLLAVETSCDETAISTIKVVNDKISVLSNVVSSQIKLHAKYGGVVPSLASREHAKNIVHVFKTALKEARIKDFKKEIDLIAVTRGPGLGPALLVGLTFAKTLAWIHRKPLVGVNHLEGHIYSNWIPDNNNKVPKNCFPALNLVVSGGHTELVLMKKHGSYKIIGETLDDAIGEAFDKVARLLGLGYPGGPAISKIAETGDSDAYPLPSPMMHSKNYNFSYSGLKTAVLYLLRDLKIKRPPKKVKADIAASFQKAAIDVLLHKTIRAAKEYKVKTLLLSGGVSANNQLRERLGDIADDLGLKHFKPAMKYTTDNAAMIAVAGYFNSKKNKTTNYNSIAMDANLTL